MNYRRKHIKPKIDRFKNKKWLIKKPLFWLLALFIILISGAFQFILFYPKFQISNIQILGNAKTDKKDIEDLAWIIADQKIFNIAGLNIKTKSIFTINGEKLKENILKKIPQIKEIKIQKKFPQDIILEVKERQPFAVFCQNEQECFLIDKDGVIFEKSNDVTIMPVMRKDSIREVFLGENVFDKNIMDIIYQIINNLKDNFGITIKEVLLSDLLVFKTSENWQIYFDAKSDIGSQITKMNILLKDEIPLAARKDIQYIYLQYKDKAYYK